MMRHGLFLFIGKTVLNIPKVTTSTPTPATTSTPKAAAASESTPTMTPAAAMEVKEEEESIGEFDDGRSGKLTLSTLIGEGLIEPGEGVLAIEYLGQTFKGDLLPVGKIRSQETGLLFNNPSAWAIYCKKIVNPAKKSGCGWASVKYKGKKMDTFKSIWTKLKSQKELEEKKAAMQQVDVAAAAVAVKHEHEMPFSSVAIVRHAQLGPKQPSDPLDVLVECDSFAIQPFTVSASSSALLVMDLHSHLSSEPAFGYLAGHWDINTHNLAITHTFPCLFRPNEDDDDDDDDDDEREARCEYDIYKRIYERHLTLVGWYKSDPKIPRSLPSLKDSESQLEHQVKLLGSNDASYTPCVGIIVKPFANLMNESDLCFFWVIPPNENAPNEYGQPMKMNHSVVQDPCLSQECLRQIDKIIEHHKNNPKATVDLRKKFNSDTTLMTKMGRSILTKFPRDQDETLWKYVRREILGEDDLDEEEDPLIASVVNGSLNGHNNGGGGEDHEEEIDDDEDHALKVRRRGSRVMSLQSNGSGASSSNAVTVTPVNLPPPVASTDEVISLLLNKAAPVAPSAHRASSVASSSRTNEDEEAPLDFSTPSKMEDDK